MSCQYQLLVPVPEQYLVPIPYRYRNSTSTRTEQLGSRTKYYQYYASDYSKLRLHFIVVICSKQLRCSQVKYTPATKVADYICQKIIHPKRQCFQALSDSKVGKMADATNINDLWIHFSQLSNEAISLPFHHRAIIRVEPDHISPRNNTRPEIEYLNNKFHRI